MTAQAELEDLIAAEIAEDIEETKGPQVNNTQMIDTTVDNSDK